MPADAGRRAGRPPHFQIPFTRSPCLTPQTRLPRHPATATFRAPSRSRRIILAAQAVSFRLHDEAMGYFLQQLINGLTLGAIYGLIAIGYTMVYGIIGMINFAHGEIFMIGSFIGLIFILALTSAGIAYVPLALLIVLLCAMGFTAVYGWTIERIAYRPLRGSFRLAPLISAIGMSIFLQNYVQLLQG